MAINSNGMKWGAPALGTSGGVVTWSFGETDTAGLWGTEAFQPWVRAAFNLWESFANIDFVESSARGSGVIDVDWGLIDGISGTLGQANWYYQDREPIDTAVSATVTFDSGDLWDIGPSANPSGANFFAVALHEIGHAIGLDHSSDPNSLMYFQLNDQRGPSLSDRAAIQEIYGPQHAPAVAPDTEAPGSASQDVFRFFNTANGSHFYTGSVAERDQILATLPQYRLEGNAFDTPAADDASMEVFRFFNTQTGTHFFTASAEERDQISATLSQYRFEGVAYEASATDGGGTREPLYRFYNTENGTHFFTAGEEEMISVLGHLDQYRYEGIAYYVDAA